MWIGFEQLHVLTMYVFLNTEHLYFEQFIYGISICKPFYKNKLSRLKINF